LTIGTKAAELYGSFRLNDAIAIATNSTTPTAKNFEKAGFIFSGNSADGNSWNHRAERPSIFWWRASFIQNSEQAAPTASAVQRLHRRRAPEHSSQAALANGLHRENFGKEKKSTLR